MPRSARLVFPDVAHHVVQRGNRQQDIFFSDDNRRAYLSILSHALHKHGTRCFAWCLMDNHVHLILVPRSVDGLRAPLASTHTTYAQLVNREQNVSGHLFQGRYSSYPMDDTHLMIATRYVENNPVKAGLVTAAEDWPWSSARAHIERRADDLTDVAAIGQHVENWKAFLRDGVEASDQVEQSVQSGKPLADPAWWAELAARNGLSPATQKRGRPPKAIK